MAVALFRFDVGSKSCRSEMALGGVWLGVLAGVCVLIGGPGSSAQGAIVTRQFSTVIGSGGETPVDGASHPNGTSVLFTLKFDDAVTYAGAPDTYTRTLVSITEGMRIDIGADVFTADQYYIDVVNAGVSFPSSSIDFRSGSFPWGTFPVKHNGVVMPHLFAYMQASFFDGGPSMSLPETPGLAFDLPPYVGEGFVRDGQGGDFSFPYGSYTDVPAPAGAGVMMVGGVMLLRSRRRRCVTG